MRRDLKNVFILLVLALFVLSCNDGKNRKINDPYDGGHGIGIDTEKVDSITNMESQESKEVISKEHRSSISSGSYSSSSSSDVDDDEYDNMRSFDPASEDDMDDNGMSRYIENTDEEGWD